MNRILTSLIIVLTFAVTDAAHAASKNVGPTNFHHQIQIPNSMGSNHRTNNEDSVFQTDSRKKKRSERMRKKRGEQQAQNEETRTASDEMKTDTKGHKRRQEKNRTATQKRLQERAVQKVLDESGFVPVND